jgi:hypothetical protein
LESRKRIIYCAKVYESISLIGMGVWWLSRLFGCGRLKVFSVYRGSAESVLQNLVVFKLEEKSLVLDQDQPTPLFSFSSLFIVVLIFCGFTHCPLNHDGYCLSKR